MWVFLDFLGSLDIRLIKYIQLEPRKNYLDGNLERKPWPTGSYLQKSEKFCDAWCCGGRCVHQDELVSKKHNFYLPCIISLKREILKFPYVKIKKIDKMVIFAAIFHEIQNFRKNKSYKFFNIFLSIVT